MDLPPVGRIDRNQACRVSESQKIQTKLIFKNKTENFIDEKNCCGPEKNAIPSSYDMDAAYPLDDYIIFYLGKAMQAVYSGDI